MSGQSSSRHVWLVDPVTMIGFVAASVVTPLVAWVVCTGPQPLSGGLKTGIWIFVALVWCATWRWALWPRVELTDFYLEVRNPIRSYSIAYQEIADLAPGYYGLWITLADRRCIVAWAVQKANAARWTKRRARADDLVDAIRGRMSVATQ